MDSGSATLDQVLGMLAQVAMSQSMAAEIAAYKTNLLSTVPYTITDLNGNPESLVLDDSTAAAWLPANLLHAETALGLKLLAPFPAMMLYGDPPNYYAGSGGGEFRGVGFRGYQYHINAAIFCSSDSPVTAQRQARMLCTCFDQLVWRNHEARNFGQFVQVIESDAPVEESGVQPYKSTLVAGARVRFSVMTLPSP